MKRDLLGIIISETEVGLTLIAITLLAGCEMIEPIPRPEVEVDRVSFLALIEGESMRRLDTVMTVPLIVEGDNEIWFSELPCSSNHVSVIFDATGVAELPSPSKNLTFIDGAWQQETTPPAAYKELRVSRGPCAGSRSRTSDEPIEVAPEFEGFDLIETASNELVILRRNIDQTREFASFDPQIQSSIVTAPQTLSTRTRPLENRSGLIGFIERADNGRTGRFEIYRVDLSATITSTLVATHNTKCLLRECQAAMAVVSTSTVVLYEQGWLVALNISSGTFVEVPFMSTQNCFPASDQLVVEPSGNILVMGNQEIISWIPGNASVSREDAAPALDSLCTSKMQVAMTSAGAVVWTPERAFLRTGPGVWVDLELTEVGAALAQVGDEAVVLPAAGGRGQRLLRNAPCSAGLEEYADREVLAVRHGGQAAYVAYRSLDTPSAVDIVTLTQPDDASYRRCWNQAPVGAP